MATAIDAFPEKRTQSNLAAASGIVAGLVLEQHVIRQVLQRDLMKESVIYQELREEARQEVRDEVRQEVRDEVRNEVRQEVQDEVRQEERLEEARSLILRLLTRKVGDVPGVAKTQIDALKLAQLEALGEALLSFETQADLSEWLGQVLP